MSLKSELWLGEVQLYKPVVSELVETPKRPLVQVEQQGGPHTLELVGRDVALQVLRLHRVETVPHPNVAPILIPTNMAEWATLNLGYKVLQQLQILAMYQKVQEFVRTAFASSRQPTCSQKRY